MDLAAFPPSEPGAVTGVAPTHDSGGQQLSSLPRPIIGYTGGLHRHVDFDLLAQMAEARPDWSWVLVGPFQASVEKLQGYGNIHLLGPRPHEELSGHLLSFDVCIVPYLKSAYTDTVVPVKINEYLASGKPVVSTDIPTVREFNERHSVLITTDNNRDDFLKSIEEALLLPNDEATIARRRAVAALCDWSVQLEAMSKLF